MCYLSTYFAVIIVLKSKIIMSLEASLPSALSHKSGIVPIVIYIDLSRVNRVLPRVPVSFTAWIIESRLRFQLLHGHGTPILDLGPAYNLTTVLSPVCVCPIFHKQPHYFLKALPSVRPRTMKKPPCKLERCSPNARNLAKFSMSAYPL